MAGKTKKTAPLTSTEPSGDRHYTPAELARTCVAFLREHVDLGAYDLIVEPSAGAGVFLRQLPCPRIGIDVDPAAPEVEQADYLTWTPPPGRIAVVGNPPYGRGCAAALRFLARSADMAETVAMLLPASLETDALRRRVDRRLTLVASLPLGKQRFEGPDGAVSVQCIFQIWRRLPAGVLRDDGPARETTHRDWEWVSDPQDADLAFRRVGGRAGAVIAIPPGPGPHKGLAPASNLFLRAVGIAPATLRSRLAALDHSTALAASVAVPSVSKADVVAAYSRHLAALPAPVPDRSDTTRRPRLVATGPSRRAARVAVADPGRDRDRADGTG